MEAAGRVDRAANSGSGTPSFSAFIWMLISCGLAARLGPVCTPLQLCGRNLRRFMGLRGGSAQRACGKARPTCIPRFHDHFLATQTFLKPSPDSTSTLYASYSLVDRWSDWHFTVIVQLHLL